jgi:hypothetical protein
VDYLSCTKSSRKPEYSQTRAPGGRSDRCQRHRGLNDQPAAEADTFGLGTPAGDPQSSRQTAADHPAGRHPDSSLTSEENFGRICHSLRDP